MLQLAYKCFIAVAFSIRQFTCYLHVVYKRSLLLTITDSERQFKVSIITIVYQIIDPMTKCTYFKVSIITIVYQMYFFQITCMMCIFCLYRK